MGREVRRVPPNWEHPKKAEYNPRTYTTRETYQPLYDRDVESAWAEWLERWNKWIGGEFAEVRADSPDLNYNENEPYRHLCDWDGMPPDPEYYRPKWLDGEATWYQLYETVSEGTPLTPPFETKEELAQYLAEQGDFWGRKPTLEQATSLVKTGWAMSLMVERLVEGVKVMDAYEQQDLKTH
jgi:hypothetical protein